jgi:hypothetical protein
MSKDLKKENLEKLRIMSLQMDKPDLAEGFGLQVAQLKIKKRRKP